MAITWQNSPVVSKVKLPGSDSIYYIKDAEARAKIEALGSPTHFAGVSSVAITDGAVSPTTINGNPVSAGDIAVYEKAEFIWDGSKWVEFGDLSTLGDLAEHDLEDIVIAPGLTKDNVLGADTTITAAASSVSFDSGAGSDFVTGYNNDAVAPSFSEGTFTPASLGTGFYTAGSAAQFSEGAFTPASIEAGFVTPGVAPSFSEGAFTPASLAEGFVTAGTAATYSHSGFSGGSLGSATTGSFAIEGVVAAMGSGNDAETLIFSNAQESDAVTAQGSFTPAVYGTDTFNGGTPTAIDVTKFSGGSKVADTFSAGSVTAIDVTKFDGGSKAADTFVANTPAAIDVTKFNGGSKASDTFNAGSAATLAKAKALTASDTGTAAAQTITVASDDVVAAVTNVAPSAIYSN